MIFVTLLCSHRCTNIRYFTNPSNPAHANQIIKWLYHIHASAQYLLLYLKLWNPQADNNQRLPHARIISDSGHFLIKRTWQGDEKALGQSEHLYSMYISCASNSCRPNTALLQQARTFFREANIERAALTCGPNRAICEAADCLRSMTEEPHHQLELLGLRWTSPRGSSDKHTYTYTCYITHLSLALI